MEVVLPTYLSAKIVEAMIGAHPYEEPAYDLVALSNTHPGTGSGWIGELPGELDEKEF